MIKMHINNLLIQSIQYPWCNNKRHSKPYDASSQIQKLLYYITILLVQMEIEHHSLTTQDFKMLSVIGRGSYAKVVLVKRKKGDTEKSYAMKILKKKYIEKKKQENYIKTERNILIGVEHPFIVKLHSAFQNPKKLFFVLQYCPGGQLFGLLQKKHRLSEQQAKFYISQVVLALQYLHSKDIIYRDLKPENILIDQQGFIKITDFGLSQMNVSDENMYTICGTPEYLAPQILNKEGYGKPVDWWCLGSILYELVVGLPPFYSKTRAQLFDRIKLGEPVIPPYVSQKLKELIQQLLKKKSDQRLCSKHGAEQIKKHPWFQNVNWELLLKRKVKVPFIPDLQSNQDVQYFDTTFTQQPIQSINDSEVKSDDGKVYSDFSWGKSSQDKLDIEQNQNEATDFQMIQEP